MHKNFDSWNTEKKTIDTHDNAALYHEREIWFCSLGTNIGNEQNGTGVKFDRPVVIIKGFNKSTFFSVGLTGHKKAGKYFMYLGTIHDRDASANLSQVRTVDTKRLVRKIGMLDEQIFQTLKKRLQEALFTNLLKPESKSEAEALSTHSIHKNEKITN